MNTMRVGAEDGKLLVPVDLARVGWLRLRCDAISPEQSQPVGRSARILRPLSGGDQMTKVDGEWLREFDDAMMEFFAIDHSDAGMDEFLLARYMDLPAWEAALAFGEDYDLVRMDSFWSLRHQP